MAAMKPRTGDGPLGADDLRRVRFSLALRGYRMNEVDALLARLAAEHERDREQEPAVSAGVPAAVRGVDQPLARVLAEQWAREHPAGADILDLSVESVDQVESSLDQWSRQPERGLSRDELDVWAAGAYLGEVLIRAVPGAAWSRQPADDGLPLVAMPSGRLVSPIGKAMERYDGDEQDSVIPFVEATLAAEDGRL